MEIVVSLTRSVLCAVACVAFVAGCEGSQSSIEPPATMQADAIGSRAGHGQASMATPAYARSLLYVALETTAVYTYPRGKPLGLLGDGGYLCSDRFGNVVVSGAAGV